MPYKTSLQKKNLQNLHLALLWKELCSNAYY